MPYREGRLKKGNLSVSGLRRHIPPIAAAWGVFNGCKRVQWTGCNDKRWLHPGINWRSYHHILICKCWYHYTDMETETQRHPMICIHSNHGDLNLGFWTTNPVFNRAGHDLQGAKRKLALINWLTTYFCVWHLIFPMKSSPSSAQ